MNDTVTHSRAYRLRRRALVAVLLAGLVTGPSMQVAAQEGRPATASDGSPAQQAAPPPSTGRGDVNLSPKRVVIRPGQRAGEIILFNRGDGTADYEVRLEDRRMTPEGGIVALTGEGSVAGPPVQGAASIVRISPRRVTLGPGQAQVVRVAVRSLSELPDGEYRTHFSVVARPQEATGLTIDQATNQVPAGAIEVRITPLFGISIPIIVRKGETNVTAGLEGVRLQANADGRQQVALRITRAGNRSVFGDFTVHATAPGGRRVLVGEVRGVAVYTELEARDLAISLRPDLPPLPPGTVLDVTYTDDDGTPGRVLATAQALVP